jgi:hypothetical protein
MVTPNVRRSQAMLRLPVDQLSATMILHDGSRSEIVLFVPCGETVQQLVTQGDAFLPVIRERSVSLVARAAIACVTVAVVTPMPRDTDVPSEHQVAVVHLRSGQTVRGELRWGAAVGRQRTADFLNDPTPYIEVHGDGVVHLVVKAHIAMVDEK